jgi:hypothetical protein
MARKLVDIKQELTSSFLSNAAVREAYSLNETAIFENEFSKVSIENILFDVFAFCSWTLEKLFDTHKTELSTALAEQKVGTLSWYRSKALAFQYGFNLLVDSDQYDNTNKSDQQIQDSKIIKYAAVQEAASESRVIIKIAGENAGVLAPISNVQNDAFKSYMDEIKFAGIKLTVINYLPDKLSLSIKIYRDPLLLDANGNSILYGGKPVEQAIKQYMKELPFNGELVLAHLVDKLQQVEGVVIPHIINAQSAWVDPNLSGYGLFETINVKAIPQSGYFVVENFEGIEYVV